jgi:hypothetical protein
MAAVVVVECGVGTTMEDDASVIVVERSERKKNMYGKSGKIRTNSHSEMRKVRKKNCVEGEAVARRESWKKKIRRMIGSR